MIRIVLSASIAFLIATPAMASGGEDAGLLYPIINFVLLIAALVYFARKPVLEFFNDRRGEIQNDLKKSSDLLGEAEAKFASWQRKLADLDQELETIRETSRQRAESERANIIADATASAERIRADATAAIEQELRRARGVLREEAADLALELAENLLQSQVNDGDRERLVGEFIERIEQPTTSGTGEGADR
jgi:F-type H+-transporting ATPase subunit b